MTVIDNLDNQIQRLRQEFQRDLGILDEKTLARGKFLRAKRELMSKPEFKVLTHLFDGANGGLIEKCESELGLILPAELKIFYALSNGYDGEHVMVQNCQGLAKWRKVQKEMVELHEVFHENYLRLFEFARCVKMPISIWMDSLETQNYGKVLLHDLIDRKLYIIANSMEHFFEIFTKAFIAGREPEFFEPGDEADSIGRENLFPFLDQEGVTVFNSDELENLNSQFVPN